MSREKQIEEMAEIMRHSCENECFRNKDNFPDCETCEARLLYNAGYRKQSECEQCGEKTRKTIARLQEIIADTKSEIAREIFEEIEGITDLFAKGLIGELEMYDMLAELKKKYTEEK